MDDDGEGDGHADAENANERRREGGSHMAAHQRGLMAGSWVDSEKAVARGVSGFFCSGPWSK